MSSENGPRHQHKHKRKHKDQSYAYVNVRLHFTQIRKAGFH